MEYRIPIQPLSRLARTADMLMIPVMYLISGTFRESPQETHRWNNVKFKGYEIHFLKQSIMVHCSGSSRASRRWLGKIPLFHMPLFGGWKEYVVIAPLDTHIEWYIGWIADDDAVGMSRIPLTGKVRLLLGPNSVKFFGVNAQGEQIQVLECGRGHIGDGGPFKKLPFR